MKTVDHQKKLFDFLNPILESHRVLALVGGPGVGKTELALTILGRVGGRLISSEEDRHTLRGKCARLITNSLNITIEAPCHSAEAALLVGSGDTLNVFDGASSFELRTIDDNGVWDYHAGDPTALILRYKETHPNSTAMFTLQLKKGKLSKITKEAEHVVDGILEMNRDADEVLLSLTKSRSLSLREIRIRRTKYGWVDA